MAIYSLLQNDEQEFTAEQSGQRAIIFINIEVEALKPQNVISRKPGGGVHR
jgi:hypothetical protein